MQSTPETVFNCITDFSRYQDWHPAITITESELKKGGHVFLQIRVKSRTIKKKVVISGLTKNKELSWQGRLFNKGPINKGLMQGLSLIRHSFFIEVINAKTIRFVNQEEFGLLYYPILIFTRKVFENRYDQMNEALKQHCEKAERKVDG